MNTFLHILLADDDEDDCLFFKEALEEIELKTEVKVVNNGEQLMCYLNDHNHELADVLFLDINMPRKNGIQCLSEIKANERLKKLPVIIFSTSYDTEKANQLYDKGAHYYVCKPSNFLSLKKILEYALQLISNEKNKAQPPKEQFYLNNCR